MKQEQWTLDVTRHVAKLDGFPVSLTEFIEKLKQLEAKIQRDYGKLVVASVYISTPGRLFSFLADNNVHVIWDVPKAGVGTPPEEDPDTGLDIDTDTPEDGRNQL